MSDRALTPKQLAERWQVKSDSVLSLIRSGALRAFNVGQPGKKKPRWRIAPDAIAEFENLRRAGPCGGQAARPHRAKTDADYVEFF